MPKFEVAVTRVSVYEVEADSLEQAFSVWEREAALGLEPIDEETIDITEYPIA